MTQIPVMMIHGFASSFDRNWREPGWVDLLTEQGRTVIGVDLLGHGSAEKPHDPAAYAGLEQSITARLPPDGQVDAIGFSMGAQLLLRVAAAAPKRFRRIVIGGAGDNVFAVAGSDVTARAIETGQAPDGGDPAAAALAHFALAPGNDRAALAACLRRPRAALSEADVAAVRVPVLVVLGERDFAGPADKLMAALPDARLLSLSGTDHFGTPKDFRFLQAALDFVRC
jgi:pimeloyl-ACP methyl ester carboxylesterase